MRPAQQSGRVYVAYNEVFYLYKKQVYMIAVTADPPLLIKD